MRFHGQRFKKTVIAVTMAAMTVVNCIGPMRPRALEWGANIGTSAALGSPLLNETSWESEDWNPWELVCFGVFLSNFPVPLVDDYMSCFQQGNGGTDGRGLDALIFGVSNDTQAMKVLEKLLSYTLLMQPQGLTPIKARYHTIDDTLSDDIGTLTTDDGNDAVLKDLFIKVDDGFFNDLMQSSNYKDDERPSVGNIKNINVDWHAGSGDMNIEYASTLYLPEFYIVPTGSTSVPKCIFDLRDGYDVNVLAAALSRAASSNYGKTIKSNIEDYWDSPLYFDVFGNICVIINGKAVIVLPACTNQHLTKEGQYNFLSATFLGDNYLRGTGASATDGLSSLDSALTTSYVTNYEMNLGTPATYLVSSDSGNLGRVMMFNDTDTLLFQKAADLMKTSSITMGDALEKVKDDGFKGASWGNIVYNLVNCGMTTERIQMPFKIEVTGSAHAKDWTDWLMRKGFGTSTADSASIIYLADAVRAASFISNWFPARTDRAVLNKMITLSGDSQLFKEKTYYAPFVNNRFWVSQYVNFALNYMDNSQSFDIAGSHGARSQADMTQSLKASTTLNQVSNVLFTSKGSLNDDPVDLDDQASGLYVHWAKEEVSQYKNLPSNDSTITVDDVGVKEGLFAEWTAFNNRASASVLDEEFNLNCTMARICGVYTLNSKMQTASKVYNVKEGTEFGSYTPWIYLTYLDFYGVIDDQSKFDPAIFNNGAISATEAEQLFDGATLTDEEKEKQITDYVYALLDPDSGSEYRNKLLNDFFSNWIYDQYTKTVFGTDSKSITSSLSSNAAEGFLKLHTMQDNTFIGWAVDFYVNNFITIFGILLIAVFIVAIGTGAGILKAIGSTVAIASMMTLSPSLGEIAPYVCNNIIQNMFQENMSYWAISEGVESAKIEAASGGDSETSSYIRMLNLTTMDKTIMIKNDISKKVVEDISGIDYAKLQRLKSTRWMFPALMRQISADDGTADYVYVSLQDAYRNWDSLYWFYRDSTVGGDRITTDMNNSSSDIASTLAGVNIPDYSGNDKNILSLSEKSAIYGPYRDTRGDANTNNLDYHSLSRAHREDNENVHTSFYLLNFGSQLKVQGAGAKDSSGNLPELNDSGAMQGGITTKTWDKYAEIVNRFKSDPNSFVGQLKTIADDYIFGAISHYNSYEESIANCFGYFWATENPGCYFYLVIKDTFDPDLSTGGVIYELQGYYDDLYDDDGNIIKKDVHMTFMRDQKTGGLRDFLDMEELFTNVIPYLYTMQIVAGGNNDDNGAFGSELLDDYYAVYKGNKKSWLFQSNWVTKIEEARMYNLDNQIIGYIDDAGNHATAQITGGLHPSNYEPYRDMIFSEAQMLSMGLTEADLSYVENKILEVNAKVSRDWIMLLNFANTRGMSPQILYRQMAVDAMLDFDQEFSTGNGISGSYALYPTTLDLRNLSFDAVMKLLIMSSTNNVQSVNQDAMKTVLQRGDWFGGILLLLTAWICSFVLPLARDLAMAVVIVLLVWELVAKLFVNKGNRTKLMVGAILIYLKYIVFTILYYFVYYILITVSSPDTVLSADKIAYSQDHSAWAQIVIILAATIIYIVFVLIKQIMVFAWKHKEDMGFDASMTALAQIGGRVAGAAKSIVGGITGAADYVINGTEGRPKSFKEAAGLDGGSSGGSGGSSGSGGSGSSGRGGSGGSGSGSGKSSDSNHPETKGARRKDVASGYSQAADTKYKADDPESIDKCIERGKQVLKDNETYKDDSEYNHYKDLAKKAKDRDEKKYYENKMSERKETISKERDRLSSVVKQAEKDRKDAISSYNTARKNSPTSSSSAASASGSGLDDTAQHRK